MQFTYITIKLESEPFVSSKNNLVYTDYVNAYFGEIYLLKENDTTGKRVETHIGSVKLIHVLMRLAMNEGFSILELLDSDSDIANVMLELFDFDDFDYVASISDDICNRDVMIVDRVDIFPKYRSKGYGKRVMKEISRRYLSSVGMIAVKAFPLQLESKRQSDMKSHKEKYGMLEKDEAKAKQSLYGFYKKCGFEHVEGISKEIMVLINY